MMEENDVLPRQTGGAEPAKAKFTPVGLQPGARAVRAVLLGGVWVYQRLISPLTPASCRFAPTCSAYAAEAIRRHGPLKGSKLAAARIAKCRPGGGSGYDPVPD